MTFVLPSIGGGIIASPTAPPASFSTSSVELDGTDDYMTVTPSSSIDLYGFSAWFKSDNVISASSGVQGVLLGQSGLSYFLALGGNITGDFTNELITIRQSAQNSFAYTSPSATIDTNWHHIAASWSSSSATTGGDGYDIYLDGVKVGNSAGTSTPSSPYTLSSTFAIGARANGTYTSGGLIDEVAIFDSTLSASDITSIYNSGTPNDISSLNPVGWWRMGENDGATGTTITDQGSGGNDGTLVNGPTFSTTVPLGPLVLPSITNSYALSFDGSNDYADCGVLTELHGASTMSLSFWFKSDTSGEGPSMGSRTGSTNQWGFLRAGSVNYVQIVTGGTGKYFSYSSPADTNYHHYLLTFSSGSINFYIDGAAVSISLLNIGSGSVPALHSESVSFDLGRNATFYSHGLIDEVSLFSTALTQREITAIYNSGTPNDISSLSPLGWWRNGDNDSGTGTTVTDQGSGSNDATLTNGPTFSTTVP